MFDLKKDPDALNNLISSDKDKKEIGRYRREMVKTMKNSDDPMLGIFQNRKSKEAVAAYLAKLDAESKDRKSKAEYSRSGKSRTTARKTLKKSKSK